MSFTVACAQFAATQGAIKQNTLRMRALAEAAARMSARLLVLPELCLCGYLSPGEASRLAVAADGPEIAAVRETARKTGVALSFGFAEKTPEGLFNSMAFVERDGSLRAVYRKVHLWVTEREWAREGDRLVSMGLEGSRAGMWICYDSRFPEVARALALEGVSLAVVGSAWFGPAAEWELALRARAVDNGIFVAGAAALGSFSGSPFHGTSMIVDPHGTVCARAQEGEEAVICAAYDAGAVSSFRARLPLLDDRRPGSCRVDALP